MSTFSKTQNIGAYASANGITKFDILKNPKNGNLFAVDSKGTTLRLAKDITALSNDLAISWFSPEDGDPSWMIHKAGQGAEIVSTLSFAPVTIMQEF
jgi:hypothetical protein